MNAKTDLQWNVFTIKRPGLVRDLPPGKEELMWVANSSTLICGERDAILVDTFLTTEQSQTLLDWIVASGKNLTAIYITHGHGDHFFGLASLLERFPRARAVSTPDVVKAMHEHLSPDRIENFWRRLFPGEIPDRLLVGRRPRQRSVRSTGRTSRWREPYRSAPRSPRRACARPALALRLPAVRQPPACHPA
jgi:glyoxylase-like metal-dependent hydrolase (beta-lactamase superfamily II)